MVIKGNRKRSFSIKANQVIRVINEIYSDIFAEFYIFRAFKEIQENFFENYQKIEKFSKAQFSEFFRGVENF